MVDLKYKSEIDCAKSKQILAANKQILIKHNHSHTKKANEFNLMSMLFVIHFTGRVKFLTI